MDWKKVLSILAFLFIIGLLLLYWYFPSVPSDYSINKNSNFSKEPINSSFNSSLMQFYENMRFPLENISYSIENTCNLQKKADMERAFEIIEEKTSLNFYSSNQGQIHIFCEDRNKIDSEGLFVAGEGGPANITLGKYFSVIENGQILLIKSSECPNPNIAIHELLHVLGFQHSDNSNNIMYPVSECDQIISDDILIKIQELYSYPSLPDLEFEGVSVSIKNRMLDFNYSIRNEGLIKSENFVVGVYVNDKKIKEIETEGLEMGYGQKVSVENFLLSQMKIDEIKFVIEGDFEELNKKNNEITLNVTK
ncbi:MAG: matrixin family metalloprotease [Candidatus Pacearchaeota archaeon]